MIVGKGERERKQQVAGKVEEGKGVCGWWRRQVMDLPETTLNV